MIENLSVKSFGWLINSLIAIFCCFKSFVTFFQRTFQRQGKLISHFFAFFRFFQFFKNFQKHYLLEQGFQQNFPRSVTFGSMHVRCHNRNYGITNTTLECQNSFVASSFSRFLSTWAMPFVLSNYYSLHYTLFFPVFVNTIQGTS